MAAVATNPAVAKKTKIPQSVGKEFMEADKGKKFKGGGEMKESKEMVKKEIGFMKKKGAPKSMIKHEMKEAGMKKMASGALAAGHKSADGIAMKGKTKGKEVKMALGGAAMGAVRKAVAAKAGPMLQKAKQAAPSPGIAKMPMVPGTQRGLGGMPSKPKAPPPGMNVEAIRAAQRGLGDTFKGTAPKASSLPALGKYIAGLGAAVAGKMMGKKAGGLAAGHKEADGIAKKGKTRAMQVKMAGGGKTKKYC
jgi:hypothetical protein